MAKKSKGNILQGILNLIFVVGAVLGLAAFILHFTDKKPENYTKLGDSGVCHKGGICSASKINKATGKYDLNPCKDAGERSSCGHNDYGTCITPGYLGHPKKSGICKNSIGGPARACDLDSDCKEVQCIKNTGEQGEQCAYGGDTAVNPVPGGGCPSIESGVDSFGAVVATNNAGAGTEC